MGGADNLLLYSITLHLIYPFSLLWNKVSAHPTLNLCLKIAVLLDVQIINHILYVFTGFKVLYNLYVRHMYWWPSPSKTLHWVTLPLNMSNIFVILPHKLSAPLVWWMMISPEGEDIIHCHFTSLLYSSITVSSLSCHSCCNFINHFISSEVFPGNICKNQISLSMVNTQLMNKEHWHV